MGTAFERDVVPGVKLAVGHLVIDMDKFRRLCLENMHATYSDHELLTGLHNVLMRQWRLDIPLGEWIELIEWVNGVGPEGVRT